ncbi:MAG: apolipoprotein N-acyltransferase [Desulfobacteraceae bacterium]|nr:apolipoprotein N-acyltransferase [Desulfobacteraceae bacterium]
MDWLLPIISGLILTLLFPPFSIGLLVPFAIVPLVWSLHGKTWKEAFRIGFLAGLVHFGTLIWWIAPTIATYGNLPLWASWPVVGLLACYLAVYPAVWSVFVADSMRKGHRIILLTLSAPAAWALLEWARGHFLSGFPWGSLAYSLIHVPSLIQTADIYGPYGLSFLIVLTNMIVWDLLEKTRGCCNLSGIKGRRAAAGEAALLALGVAFLWLYGDTRIKKIAETDNRYPAAYAAAIQGSIPQNEKWDPAFQQKTISTYENLSAEAVSSAHIPTGKNDIKYPILVWPETAAPFYFQDQGPLSRQVAALASKLKAIIVFGSPAYNIAKTGGRTAYLNSAYILGPDGATLGRYDKVHLVPFGEYMPFGWVTAWAKDYLPTAGEFMAGKSVAPLSFKGIHIGVLICFESIFPKLGRDLVRGGANLIAVITNDAWFGRTGAPYQHEEMAILRAVETRRWVIRAANTGVSSIISPWGETVSRTSIFHPCYTSGIVRLRDGETFFARHGGQWPPVLSIITIILIFLYPKKEVPK